MSGLIPPEDADANASTLDTTTVPLGERALRKILGHVIAVGDEAETSYLEVKSQLDMSSKSAVAKIAKFLLGAANRLPREAANHFRGYAVLIIGAQKGNAPGVVRGTEPHELEDRLGPYLGPQFPAFEFGRIAVDSDHEILFVVAQPPQEGQSIFVCHKSFQSDDRRDSLEDGAIYVRGTSNTRPARSGEVLSLIERARGGAKSPIDLEVELIGRIHRVDNVEDVLQRLRSWREEQFTKETESAEKNTSASTLFQLRPSLPSIPRPLSAHDREIALAKWHRDKAEHMARGRAHFLGVGLSGVGVRVVSRDRFVARPHLTLTFHGCELLDHLERGDADFDKAVEPVVRSRQPFESVLASSARLMSPRDYPVAWRNRGDDAEVVLTPESFRPNAPWATDQDDYVIVTRDLRARTVDVSWALSEDSNDLVSTGEFQVATQEVCDAAELFTAVFLSEH